MADKNSVLVRIDEETKVVMESIRNSIQESISSVSYEGSSSGKSQSSSAELSDIERKLKKIEDKIDDIYDILDDLKSVIKQGDMVQTPSKKEVANDESKIVAKIQEKKESSSVPVARRKQRSNSKRHK